MKVLRAENKRLKKQIIALRRYIDYWETRMGGMIIAAQNDHKQSTPKSESTVSCIRCKSKEVKSCQMRQKMYHRCQKCSMVWNVPCASK